jgi:hypothetical protein
MPNQQVTLTIAIPTYNRSEILKGNLINLDKAVKSRNSLEISILVVDNGDSSGIIKNYQYIKYVKNQFNIGANGNILKILENVDTDYLWIIGDDDYLNPDALDNVMQLIIEKSPDWLILSQNSSSLELNQYTDINDLMNSNIDLQDLIFISINIYKTNILQSNLSKITDNNLYMPHFLGVSYSDFLNKIIHYKLNPFLITGVEDNIKNMWAPITLWTGSIFDFIYKQDSKIAYENRVVFLRNIRKNWLTNKNLIWSIYLLGKMNYIEKYLIYRKIKSYIYMVDGMVVGLLTNFLLIFALIFSTYLKLFIQARNFIKLKKKKD